MLERLLIANRGEIAIRIARTASDMGIKTVSVFSEDDHLSLHTRHSESAVNLGQAGVAAYLNAENLIQVAKETGCDAIHPGYGFLSESAEFSKLCAEAGIRFVGPSPATLSQFGDKAQARNLAIASEVPVLKGTNQATTLEEANAFYDSLGVGTAVMIKALAGGGGRGMRPVREKAELEEAYARATSEAQKAFGSGDLYLEEMLYPAKHVEVQVVGDGERVVHLWDRECSLQRQRQKLVEIAPAFGLSTEIRTAMLESAQRIALAANYEGVGTIEFLVGADDQSVDRFVFMEANARLQVEHTVTEEVTGLDLVALQLRLAGGENLDEIALTQDLIGEPKGVAVQVRVNLEKMNEDGTSIPGGGVLTSYEPPSGPGIRLDGFGYNGYSTSVLYDSLLAKLIVHSD